MYNVNLTIQTMATCLLNKLKAEVANSNLIGYNEFIMYLKLPTQTWYPMVLGDPSGYVKTKDSKVYLSATSGGTPKTVVLHSEMTSNTFYIFVNSDNATEEVEIFVSRKYSDASNVMFTTAASNDCKILTKTFRNESSTTIPSYTQLRSKTSDTPVLGVLSDVSEMYNITSLNLETAEDNDVKYYEKLTKLTNVNLNTHYLGDISVFGNHILLTNLAYGNSKCSGTLESVVWGWVKNGKTSGTVTGNSSNSQSSVTFAGSRNNAKGAINWSPNANEGRTDITVNGITVTIDNATGETVS